MIRISNVRHDYGSQTPLFFPDFECKKGEQWLVLGQSGCGKSTLLQLLGGLLHLQQGEIMLQDVAISSLKNKEMDSFRGKKIGFIFQQHHFFTALNVEENLLLAQQLAGKKTDKKQIVQLLEQLQIGAKQKAAPNMLSQGEQQRVAIARAVIHQPAIILADEPTSALDDHNTNEVFQLLQQQAQLFDTTLLIVTHDTRLKSLFQEKIIQLG